MLRIHCQEPWFSLIQSGQKRVEGRKCAPKYTDLKPEELIEFYVDDRSFTASVVKVISYPTLEAYLETEGVSNALPGIHTLEEAVAIYLQFNSRETIEASGGFLGIHVSVI